MKDSVTWNRDTQKIVKETGKEEVFGRAPRSEMRGSANRNR